MQKKKKKKCFFFFKYTRNSLNTYWTIVTDLPNNLNTKLMQIFILNGEIKHSSNRILYVFK